MKMDNDNNYNYYFVPKINVSGDGWLAKPYRIVKLSEDFPVQIQGLTPYKTLRELRKNDKGWKKYHKSDPKSAEKICEDRFIITSAAFVLTPNINGFDKVSYKVLKHGVFGDLNSEITGIHLNSNLNKNLKSVREIKPEDENGVWIGEFEYYSEKRNKTYFKESSFFPKDWCPTKFMFEIYSAYIKLNNITNDVINYSSITKSGVPVEFIIRDGVINTVYPIYQEN